MPPPAPLLMRDIPHFQYTDHNKRLAWCHLKAFSTKNEKTLVVVTELQDNPGMSITNAIECVARAAVKALDIDPWKLTLIENYNAASYQDDQRPETFDVVSFAHVHPNGLQMFQGPSWRRLRTFNDAPATAGARNAEVELDI